MGVINPFRELAPKISSGRKVTIGLIDSEYLSLFCFLLLIPELSRRAKRKLPQFQCISPSLFVMLFVFLFLLFPSAWVDKWIWSFQPLLCMWPKSWLIYARKHSGKFDPAEEQQTLALSYGCNMRNIKLFALLTTQIFQWISTSKLDIWIFEYISRRKWPKRYRLVALVLSGPLFDFPPL